jgi:hypothetical protein
MKLTVRAGLLAAVTVASGAVTAHAGPLGDDLAKCLVSSSTSQDKTEIVRWVFTAVAAHPAVKPMASVTDAQREAASKAMGDLITRLLTVNCADATAKAVRGEGLSSIDTSFAALGQAAIQDLFSDPGVGAALSSMEKYVDVKRIGGLDAAAPPLPAASPPPSPQPSLQPSPSPTPPPSPRS